MKSLKTFVMKTITNSLHSLLEASILDIEDALNNGEHIVNKHLTVGGQYSCIDAERSYGARGKIALIRIFNSKVIKSYENKLEYKFPANVWVYEDALWILELFVQILLNLPMETLEKYLISNNAAKPIEELQHLFSKGFTCRCRKESNMIFVYIGKDDDRASSFKISLIKNK